MKPPTIPKSPKWFSWFQEAVVDRVEDIRNSPIRAVSLTRRRDLIFAFPFGHGRHMFLQEAIVQDFGIHIAMNSAQSNCSHSMDIVHIGDITVRQRTQTRLEVEWDRGRPV